MPAPTLHTKRLTLRAHRMGDFDAYRAAYASDRLRYMGAPLDERSSWAAFCKDVAQWDLQGHGAWAVDITSTDKFVGQVGLNKHPYQAEVELGWLVLPEGEGKGIAFEAAYTARAWGYGELGLRTLVSYIHRDNARSIALAERMGAAEDPDAPACPYDNHAVYRHPSPEALQ